jgi:DNA-binding CsgD family transcriptional regulator
MAFDGLRSGMFLVDAYGFLVHANLAGRALLASGEVLYQDVARLAARDAAADRTLRNLLAAVANGGVAGICSVALVGSTANPHVAHICSLLKGKLRQATSPYRATALVLVDEAVLNVPSATVIAETYHLTPTELKILLAIVEVGGKPEVACALGIAESTVKTHLSRIFSKTGTSSQADLIKLVLGFSYSILQNSTPAGEYGLSTRQIEVWSTKSEDAPSA